MRILVNGPSEKKKNLGGVANHIWGLKHYWKEDVRYNIVGKRSKRKGSGKYYVIWDIFKLIFKILILRPDYIWLNPSISPNALKRDFIFLNIAHRMGVKVAVFIHGFDINNFEKINKIWLRNNLNKATFVMVLAQDFRRRLIGIGVTVPIEITTTKVEDSLVKGFDINKKNYKDTNKLLYLARVEKAKGIYEAIDTYAILKTDFPELSLQVSGGGGELENAKKYVADKGIKDVAFTGFIAGKDMYDAYSTALLLLLITTHGEGLPTNVLEAMAFGLPVVTRPVGGLADFFENEKMGFISSSMNPEAFASGIRPIIEDRNKARNTGLYNYSFAKEHFFASNVASNLERLFKEYNKGGNFSD